MEPNTNEATAPKRLKSGGKKPLIIIGILAAVLLAAYAALCAYADSLDVFYPNTTINGVDAAGLTAEQAAERLRQESRQETVAFYLPLDDETGDGDSAPEGDAADGETPGRRMHLPGAGRHGRPGLREDAGLPGAHSGAESFFAKGWEYLLLLCWGCGAPAG